jgi:DNA-binding NtrC family response regulator
MINRTRKDRILVVDDEPSVLTTYQMILEKQGYEVVPARSSQQAHRALEREKIDLLLCDLSLEEKDSGFEVLEYARRQQPGLPSLLLTGYVSKDIDDRAQRHGISVLFKPIDIQEFLDVIATQLRNRHEQTEASRQ